MEQAGYEFEKGRLRAQKEAEEEEISNLSDSPDSNPYYTPPAVKKSGGSCLGIFLFILLFILIPVYLVRWFIRLNELPAATALDHFVAAYNDTAAYPVSDDSKIRLESYQKITSQRGSECRAFDLDGITMQIAFEPDRNLFTVQYAWTDRMKSRVVLEIINDVLVSLGNDPEDVRRRLDSISQAFRAGYEYSTSTNIDRNKYTFEYKLHLPLGGKGNSATQTFRYKDIYKNQTKFGQGQ